MSVRPLADIGNLPEHGRIRTGATGGKGQPLALSNFRFTSTDRPALEALANIYGGEVKAWQNKRANPPNQFELYSEASEIEVVVQPGSASTAYELWSGGGRQRSCDGVTALVSERGSGDYQETACLCSSQGVLECRIKTRLSLIFPGIPFSGTWRYESSAHSAAHELPSMLELIEALQSSSGLMPVRLVIVDKQVVKHGQTRKFKVVQIRMGVTVDEMMSGASYQTALSQGTATVAPALEQPASPDPTPLDSDDGDDDIVEAELVEDWEFPVTGLTRDAAMKMAREHDRIIKKVGTKWTVE